MFKTCSITEIKNNLQNKILHLWLLSHTYFYFITFLSHILLQIYE